MVRRLRALFAVFVAFAVTFAFQISQEPVIANAQSTSDIANALNLVRGVLPTAEQPSCTIFRQRSSRYCPAVASNCPSAYPVCGLVVYKRRSSTVRACKCTNAPQQKINYVEPCSSGTNCTPVAFTTPVPTPTSTPRGTVTPQATPTSGPLPVVYLQARNNRTGLVALNGQTLAARAGDSITYSFSGGPDAKTGVSYYVITAGPAINDCKASKEYCPCKWQQNDFWYIRTTGKMQMPPSDTLTDTVQSCQSGWTFLIQYQPMNAASQLYSMQTVTVAVTQ